jgi:hypothetical protein
MLRLRHLNNKYQKRLIRPLYGQTQLTPYATKLDATFRDATNTLVLPVVSGSAAPARGAAAYTHPTGGLVPGTVMVKSIASEGVKVAVGNDALAGERPFGLLANFIGGQLDEIGDEDEVGVWRGPDGVLELLAPAFDPAIATAYAAVTNAGAPLPLYAGTDGRLTTTAPSSTTNVVVVAHLLDVMELRAKNCVASTDYVEKLSNLPKLTKEDKQQRLATILADKANAMHRIGQGMIGPIQIRLRYEGIVRNVLVEDTLERGPLMPYDILDDLGQAYYLNQTDSEVKITPFEGKQAFPQLFRIATFPRVRKEDLYYLRVNQVEYAQDESRQAIQKQEDARLVLLLEKAIADLATARALAGTIGAPDRRSRGGQRCVLGSNEQTVLIGASQPLEPQDFYNAVTQIEINQLEAKRVIAHPADIRDLYTWDINVTGFKFKDEVFAGGKITKFGEFQIQKSIIVPQGEVFLTAEPEFVGVMPIMYSLDVEENHQVEQFYKMAGSWTR